MTTRFNIKNLIVNFLTAFVLLPMSFTQAAQPKTWGEILGVDPNSCTFRLAESVGMSPYSFRDDSFSLEAKYCERMNIGRWDSAFAEGRDLPAELLNTQTSKLEFENLNNAAEIENIVKLNNQAQVIWDELVQCQGSAEKARQAYLNLDSKCAMDKKLSDYSLSVQSFLMSSAPATKDKKYFVILHPLLTQILLENANATSWSPGIDPLPTDGSKYLRGLAIELISDGLGISDLENPTPENVQAFNRKHFHIRMLYDEKRMDIQRLMSFTYRQMNAINWLNFNQANDCASLGLWPGVSRVVTHELGKDSSVFRLGTDELSKRYMNACGDMRYTDSPYSGSGRAAYDILKQFRKLSTRFK
jgi:hypothetical protein